MHKEHDVPTFKPSASKHHILDPNLYVPGESRRKKQAKKEKMKPEDQRSYAANKKRQSFKELPIGWTRDKVGIKKICAMFYVSCTVTFEYTVWSKKLMWILLKAYKAAPSKTFWLSQWNRDYPNFQLDMNKAKRWENDYAKKEKTEKQMKEDTESFLQA